MSKYHDSETRPRLTVVLPSTRAWRFLLYTILLLRYSWSNPDGVRCIHLLSYSLGGTESAEGTVDQDMERRHNGEAVVLAHQWLPSFQSRAGNPVQIYPRYSEEDSQCCAQRHSTPPGPRLPSHASPIASDREIQRQQQTRPRPHPRLKVYPPWCHTAERRFPAITSHHGSNQDLHVSLGDFVNPLFPSLFSVLLVCTRG